MTYYLGAIQLYEHEIMVYELRESRPCIQTKRRISVCFAVRFTPPSSSLLQKTPPLFS